MFNKRMKDPPGYPGDEVIRKAFGEALRQARLESGLTTDQAATLLRKQVVESELNGDHRNVGRALGILVRRIRESKGISRVQLAECSGLSLRFIISAERGQVRDGGDLCQLVRLSYGLQCSLEQFVQDLCDLETALSGGGQ